MGKKSSRAARPTVQFVNGAHERIIFTSHVGCIIKLTARSTMDSGLDSLGVSNLLTNLDTARARRGIFGV
jgi:hypothetical protein